MFINEGALKKQIKKAYKNGLLVVGIRAGMLYVSGSTWAILADKEAVSNKMKAALVELIGDIPEDGTLYRYSTDEIQSIIGETVIELDLDSYHTAPVQTYHETRVIVKTSDGEGLYLQGDDLDHIIVPREVYDLYDDGNLAKDETQPEPPRMDGKYLTWGNNVMVLKIWARKSAKWQGENDFLKAIEGVDLCWTFKE